MEGSKARFILALLILSLTSCVGSISTQIPTRGVLSEVDTNLIVDDYPRGDGSTSALPLQILVACKILGVPCNWQEPTPFLDSTRRIAPDLDFEEDPQKVERISAIYHSGTHESYMNLIDKQADLILVAREPSEDELNAAQRKRVRLYVRPVALDAFVFLENVENPVKSLTIDEIKAVYSGVITEWAILGAPRLQGEDRANEIHTYQRNPNSGSQELMEKLVMQGTPMVDSPDMILETMMGPINAISQDSLGIGYSVYFYAVFVNPNEQVKLIGVDGVIPTSDTIANRSYPLTTEVYVVIREGTRGDYTAALLSDWLLIEEGQEVIAESGYVPLR